jgi:hypothetical protein
VLPAPEDQLSSPARNLCSIKQQHGIVSTYSNRTQRSVAAAWLTCTNVSNEITG